MIERRIGKRDALSSCLEARARLGLLVEEAVRKACGLRDLEGVVRGRAGRGSRRRRARNGGGREVLLAVASVLPTASHLCGVVVCGA